MIKKLQNVLFIKLGEKGVYEKDCIKNGTIKLGYNEIEHSMCLEGRWDDIFQDISKKYKTPPGATTSHRNQIKKFYEESKSTMWITFFEGKLWYCNANEGVTYNAVDGTKERSTVSPWKSVDSLGNQLFTQSLSGRLTKVQGFRGTICNVLEKNYLIDKIHNKQSSELASVERDIVALKGSLQNLIKNLSPQDFEVFVDLIFRAAGWSRSGTLGKTTKTIDIELLAPVTNERAVVQVKSQSSLQLFHEYEERLNDMGDYDKSFYVTHTPDSKFQEFIDGEENGKIHIWDSKRLSELSINAGLLEWLISVAH